MKNKGIEQTVLHECTYLSHTDRGKIDPLWQIVQSKPYWNLFHTYDFPEHLLNNRTSNEKFYTLITVIKDAWDGMALLRLNFAELCLTLQPLDIINNVSFTLLHIIITVILYTPVGLVLYCKSSFLYWIYWLTSRHGAIIWTKTILFISGV